MSKLLVVDKSVFHTLHHCDDKPCTFAKDYNVVLPHALATECVISERKADKEPDRLLISLDKAIKAGAKMGYSLRKLFLTEKTNLSPAATIVDEEATEQFRNGTPNTTDDFIEQEAEYCRKDFEQIIESVSKIAVALYDNLSKCEELSKKLRKENKDRVCRFVKWIRCTDTSMKSVLKQLFSAQISSHADVYWFTWQRARLYLTYALDWLFIKNLPGSCEKEDISNNLYDIEYVTYLCRADGLLTNDQRLQVPLAKAAFPGKDVFEVNTTLNTSRKVQDVLDDIVEKIPPSYRIG